MTCAPFTSFCVGIADVGRVDLNHLGGKGANLAEMASIGFPVPSGFTVPTPWSASYYDAGG